MEVPNGSRVVRKVSIVQRVLDLGRNIMLDKDENGILNDWDHALWIDAEPTDRIVSLSSSRSNQPSTDMLS